MAMVLSKSKGLLVSMCLRYDHAFLAPKSNFNLGYTREEREELLTEMSNAYDAFLMNELHEYLTSQTIEEIRGEGFYSIEKEESYVKWYDNANS